jgi:glutamate--cysteine ligase
MRKLRVSLRVQPIVTAMFANSPFVEGKITNERSRRARVWLDVDPDRSGLLPFAWRENARFLDYIEWALDVPMFLVKHGDKVLRNTGQTFRAFFRDGFEGEHATMDDWLTHLNTLFPEVRLKKTIEMRGADSQQTDLIVAQPALWKGLLHDETALNSLEDLGNRWNFEELQAARPAIARDGFRARLAGRDVGEWATEILGFAESGLRRIAANDARCIDGNGRDETIHLATMRALIDKGQTPADALLAAIDRDAPLEPQVIDHAGIERSALPRFC